MDSHIKQQTTLLDFSMDCRVTAILLREKGVRPRPRPWLCAPSGGATVDVPKLSSRSKGLSFD